MRRLAERVGIVVIGRDQERRLRTVLESVLGLAGAVVYADSGSSDGSVQLARDMGVATTVLDASMPHTAARGRNGGFELLLTRMPEAEYVQFVDGDTVLHATWLKEAVAFLDEQPEVHVVAGRLYEERRDRNVWHRLADMEWNSGKGEVQSTGGTMLVRAAAFQAVRGFDATLAAGEEFEFCSRVRRRGGRVVRLSQPMGFHDIDMDRFGQWWRRSMRTGRTNAELLQRWNAGDKHRARHVTSALLWGAVLPSAAFGLTPLTRGASLALALGYPLLWRRIYAGRLKWGDSQQDAALYATACMVGKSAEALGIAQFGWESLTRARR